MINQTLLTQSHITTTFSPAHIGHISIMQFTLHCFAIYCIIIKMLISLSTMKYFIIKSLIQKTNNSLRSIGTAKLLSSDYNIKAARNMSQLLQCFQINDVQKHCNYHIIIEKFCKLLDEKAWKCHNEQIREVISSIRQTSSQLNFSPKQILTFILLLKKVSILDPTYQLSGFQRRIMLILTAMMKSDCLSFEEVAYSYYMMTSKIKCMNIDYRKVALDYFIKQLNQQHNIRKNNKPIQNHKFYGYLMPLSAYLESQSHMHLQYSLIECVLKSMELNNFFQQVPKGGQLELWLFLLKCNKLYLMYYCLFKYDQITIKMYQQVMKQLQAKKYNQTQIQFIIEAIQTNQTRCNILFDMRPMLEYIIQNYFFKNNMIKWLSYKPIMNNIKPIYRRNTIDMLNSTQQIESIIKIYDSLLENKSCQWINLQDVIAKMYRYLQKGNIVDLIKWELLFRTTTYHNHNEHLINIKNSLKASNFTAKLKSYALIFALPQSSQLLIIKNELQQQLFKKNHNIFFENLYDNIFKRYKFYCHHKLINRLGQIGYLQQIYHIDCNRRSLELQSFLKILLLGDKLQLIDVILQKISLNVCNLNDLLLDLQKKPCLNVMRQTSDENGVKKWQIIWKLCCKYQSKQFLFFQLILSNLYEFNKKERLNIQGFIFEWLKYCLENKYIFHFYSTIQIATIFLSLIKDDILPRSKIVMNWLNQLPNWLGQKQVFSKKYTNRIFTKFIDLFIELGLMTQQLAIHFTALAIQKSISRDLTALKLLSNIRKKSSNPKSKINWQQQINVRVLALMVGLNIQTYQHRQSSIIQLFRVLTVDQFRFILYNMKTNESNLSLLQQQTKSNLLKVLFQRYQILSQTFFFHEDQKQRIKQKIDLLKLQINPKSINDKNNENFELKHKILNKQDNNCSKKRNKSPFNFKLPLQTKQLL